MYSWGIGSDTNNIAQELSLWKSLFQASTHGITDLIVFGVSKLIIHSLISKKLPSNIRLKKVLQKIQLLISSFRQIHFYHIPIGLNEEEDLDANEE